MKNVMRLGFALEYSLGHVTHAQNLKTVIAEQARHIEPVYVDLPFDGMAGAWTRLPGVRSNWSVRASLGAYLGLRRHTGHLDGALFHTQVTALFSAGLMRRVPSVVSLDATPLQFDTLGRFYGHHPGENRHLEALKKRMNERAYNSARHLVTWSEWAKASLVADYGVPAEKVTVIPPGVNLAAWSRPARPVSPDLVHLLFVGGDFGRKGGDTLMQAWERLSPSVRAHTHLHIVTKTKGVAQALPNVSVYHGLTPNSDSLRALFAQADLFVFPTRGDCLPLAVLEALASGLPVITTGVGALPEAVQHERAGLIVPPDDAQALADALTRLVQDDALRCRLSISARESACERYDATRNYAALLATVEGVARSR